MADNYIFDLDPGVTRTPVAYKNRYGITIAADLLLAGEDAFARYFSEDASEAASEPKELHLVPDANHIDLYARTERIPFDKLDAFPTTNLVSRPAPVAAAATAGA